LKAAVFAYHNMGIAGLEALAKHGFDIAAVFTHEDDPDENCWFGSVKGWAEKKDITVYTIEEINEPQWIKKITSLKPDIIFSFYYRKMICREILDIPALGAFNLHGSLLPAYRGRCPVNWVLINGEKRTGVTLHYMIDKPDAGDIVGQKEVEISFTDTARTLYDKLCLSAKELLDELLPLINKGQIHRQKQDLKAGSYYGGRRPEDGRIEWNKSAQDIYNLIRGVTEPYPGAFTFLENGEKLIIWWAEPVKANIVKVPGEVEISTENIRVYTGKDAIKLIGIEVQERRMKGSQISEYFQKGKVTKLK
jgi:UDP-4-amino-4-deoxy-L-arabinose formyltransferase/UDP-glucuronic acid dehydrogenase (UDP-4-keto-hexauronic acid decarboxylating)